MEFIVLVTALTYLNSIIAKKVLGVSMGVLAITFMSFASPQQANINGNGVIYEQNVNGLEKSKPKPPVPLPPKPPTTIVINKVISTTISTVITTGSLAAKNLAQLNDAMNKY